MVVPDFAEDTDRRIAVALQRRGIAMDLAVVHSRLEEEVKKMPSSEEVVCVAVEGLMRSDFEDCGAQAGHLKQELH